jgi:hypothetical protein
MPYDPLSAAVDPTAPDAVKRLIEVVENEPDPRENPVYGARQREFEPTVDTVPRLFNDAPPLFCTLYRKTNGTRSVTVTEGRVIEYLPKRGSGGTDDGVLEHEIDGIWDTVTPNLLKEHTLAVNQVVGVAYEVDNEGYVKASPKPEVVVRTDAAGEKSSHYQPPVGEDATGAPGTVFVILARLVGTGDAERLHVYHGGSNIEHYHDTPPFSLHEDAEGVDIFNDYDIATGRYRYHGIKSDSDNITIEIQGQDIVIDWANTKNLNLNVKSYSLYFGGESERELTITIPSQTVTTSYESDHSHTTAVDVTVDQTGSEHQHQIEDYLTELTYFSHLSGPIIDNAHQPDGAHSHSASASASVTPAGGHSHTVTVPEQTVTATYMVANQPEVRRDTAYYTLVWRAGLYVGAFDDGNGIPGIGDGETLDEKTIWVLNMSNMLDFSDPDGINNSYNIPLL